MPRVEPLQPAFNAGEFSPRLLARTDFAKYRLACRKLENLIPLPHGGATRRPGTRFVAATKDGGPAQLIPFEFSTEQAYAIEAGAGYFRFYRNQGRIEAPATDAAIANGTFETGIAGWTDQSTGSAGISAGFDNPVEMGTFQVAAVTSRQFGHAAPGGNRKHVGLLFPASDGGTVLSVKMRTSTVTASGDVVARIYTGGVRPGTQIGGDSDAVTVDTGAADYIFTWSSNSPELPAAGAFWVVLSNVDTSLNCLMHTVLDQGVGYASGGHASDPTEIADQSGGFPASDDWRIQVLVDAGDTNGVLSLDGVSGQTAIAEQEVATPAVGTLHVLTFRVIGLAGDTVALQIGETSGGAQTLARRDYGAGYHAVAFTPAVSPFYVQFRSGAAKTVSVDDVRLLDGDAMELATPYGADEVPELRWTQSADVLYLCHGAHPTMKLSRRGHTTWSLERVAFEDGPYLARNLGTTTLQPSATSGTGITITASDTAGINDGAGFRATDVGRAVRILHGATWGYAVIASIVSETAVTADVRRAFGATSASANWRFGAWSATTGYPRVATFHEQRLALANTAHDPDKFWLSQTGDFENMRPDSEAGGGTETQDDDALDYRIASAQVNAIQWMRSGTRLMVGTKGGEWVVSSDGAVVTPADIDVKQQTSIGSAAVEPVQVDNAVLYLQRGGRAVREFAFSFEADGFRSPDMTVLSESITRSRIRRMAYAANPDSLLVCVREDGALACLTYAREQDVVGWARWTMGGRCEAGPARAESVAVVPGNDGAGQAFDSTERDEIWLIVARTVDGEAVRHVEFVERAFEGPDRNGFVGAAEYEAALLAAQPDCFYVDGGLSYRGPATTTIAGLGHLEGETVKVLADGAVHPDRIVAGGAVALDHAATSVQAGLGYHHDIEPLKLDFGNPSGSAIGRRKRVQRVRLVLHETGAMALGAARDALKPLSFRTVAHAMDAAVPLFTGEVVEEIEGDYEADPRIVIRSDAPVAFTLLGMVPEVDVDAS